MRSPVQLLTGTMIYCVSIPHSHSPCLSISHHPIKEAIKPKKCALKNTADACRIYNATHLLMQKMASIASFRGEKRCSHNHLYFLSLGCKEENALNFNYAAHHKTTKVYWTLFDIVKHGIKYNKQ